MENGQSGNGSKDRRAWLWVAEPAADPASGSAENLASTLP
jgi:hypothetical protein